MRRLLVLVSVLILTTGAFAERHHYGCGMCISTDDNNGEITDCNQMRVTIDDQPAVRAEEMLPVGSLRSLAVRAPQNGGIYVTGATSGGYEVKACKAASIESALNDIHVHVSGNEISAEGPDNERWVVYFIVRAPRAATLNLSAHNGPIALRNVDGSVTARTVNGPLSIRDSSGAIDLQATNGPISLDGGSGTVKLNATNGPITVKLRGDSWDGSIDAHTDNGPVSLRMPAHFRSGVIVESEGHGPVSCRAEACRQAQRTWDDEDNRRIQFGSGSVVVHLSTVNGPVSVREQE